MKLFKFFKRKTVNYYLRQIFSSKSSLITMSREAFFELWYMEENNLNTLQRLKILNPERCKSFGYTVWQMPVLFWSTALAGEVGELCNFIKKKEYGDKVNKIDIAKEAADIIIYLDLLCTHLEIDLEQSVINKFNEVSQRVNSKIKL
jgi:NTP pyrophosphatase (non-canonical NTP hydrolase)